MLNQMARSLHIAFSTVQYKAILKLCFDLMARLEGFEPPTRCFEGSRSIQLSHRRFTISRFSGYFNRSLRDKVSCCL